MIFVGRGEDNDLWLCYVIHLCLYKGFGYIFQFTHDTIWNNYGINEIVIQLWR